jgi:hypothetical protein
MWMFILAQIEKIKSENEYVFISEVWYSTVQYGTVSSANWDFKVRVNRDMILHLDDCLQSFFKIIVKNENESFTVN